jgi:hypothetical protein
MNTTQALVNKFGETWNVEHLESHRLIHVGGFLMACGAESCITLSAELSTDDKTRGQESLLRRLETLPVGTLGTYLWHPGD